MKSYIVPGLDSTDRDLLHNHGIVFYDWNTEIIVNESQMADALQLLGATATEAATEYENMYMLTLVFNTTAPTADGDKRALDRSRRQSRANYIQACQARLQDFVTQAQANVTDGRKKLGPAQDRFVMLSRQQFVAGQGTVSEQDLAEQFERLLEVPKVKAVRVSSGAILVYTETLTASDPRTSQTYELGEY